LIKKGDLTDSQKTELISLLKNKWNENSKQTELFFAKLLEMDKISDKNLDIFFNEKLYGNDFNMEIRSSYIFVELKNNRTKILDAAIQFVSEIGRFKYIRTMFHLMYPVDKVKTRAAFEKNKSLYNLVVVKWILDDFELQDKTTASTIQ
jgi:hypothetical protein